MASVVATFLTGINTQSTREDAKHGARQTSHHGKTKRDKSFPIHQSSYEPMLNILDNGMS
jgi:hypothetical protein